jgi:hypothetical protein
MEAPMNDFVMLKSGKCHAYITLDGQRLDLGLFDTAKEAKAAYQEVALMSGMTLDEQ